MMTGQILSGVSPPVASRYQIMVMCMIFASAGISTAVFLVLCKAKVLATQLALVNDSTAVNR
jgi:putative ABC transport system permease protein